MMLVTAAYHRVKTKIFLPLLTLTLTTDPDVIEIQLQYSACLKNDYCRSSMCNIIHNSMRKIMFDSVNTHYHYALIHTTFMLNQKLIMQMQLEKKIKE